MTSREADGRQLRSRFDGREDLTPPAVLAELAGQADVQFNGMRPWDIQVHDARVYSRLLLHGSLGFGESYMDGQWDCHAMDELFDRLLGEDIDAKLLAELPHQRLARCFPCLDLATGEFPVARVEGAGRALTQQHGAIRPGKDRGGDIDDLVHFNPRSGRRGRARTATRPVRCANRASAPIAAPR